MLEIKNEKKQTPFTSIFQSLVGAPKQNFNTRVQHFPMFTVSCLPRPIHTAQFFLLVFKGSLADFMLLELLTSEAFFGHTVACFARRAGSILVGSQSKPPFQKYPRTALLNDNKPPHPRMQLKR